MNIFQRTIETPAFLDGFGYWSGQDVRVAFYPAPVDTGIIFRRTDIAGSAPIPATIGHRCESPRRTTLVAPDGSGAEVGMVEHTLATLVGLGINNIEVRCDAPELPGLDGSALPMVEVILRAGIVAQDTPRQRRRIRHPIRMEDRDTWIEAWPVAGNASRYVYEIDYGPESAIGRSEVRFFAETDDFAAEVAPARTFILLHEAELLRRNGFGLRVKPDEVLIFDENGPIDNTLRFPDECARHKLLDLMGDLALVGIELIGEFRAHRSGHSLNASLVRELIDHEAELLTDEHCGVDESERMT